MFPIIVNGKSNNAFPAQPKSPNQVPYFFFRHVVLWPDAGYGLLIVEFPRSHTTAQSVGLLWTSDQLVAVAST